MPPQIIEVPGQGQIEFPEGMSDADIGAAIKKMSPQKTAGGVANLLTGPDTMLALGSGALAGPASGFAGLAGAVLPGPEGQGADWASKVAQALSYKPRTQGGELLTKGAALPFELLHKGGVALGQKAQDAGASPGVATAIQTAAEVGPALLGPKAVGMAAPTVEAGAMGLMRSALKPPKASVLSGDADSAILTMLKDGTLPTKGGLEKMRSEIDALDNQITQAVANSNGSVPMANIGKLLQDKLNEVRKQANPNADMAAVRNAWMEFVNHPLLQNSNLIPVQLAQEMKRATYKALGERAYDKRQGAGPESEKTIARGLKEGVAAAVPEAAPINARMSELINASDILENRLAVSGNRNPVSFGALAPTTGKLLAWLIDRSDATKGLGANALYDMSRPRTQPGILEAILAEQQAQRK